MATSLSYDLPNALKISPSISVSKPSDSVATADVYKVNAQSALNLFKPLKLNTDEFKKSISEALGGLKAAQDVARKASQFATDASIFSKSLSGALKVNPANLIQGLMKLDPRVSNAIGGFLSSGIVKSMGALVGTAVMINGVVQNVKNLKADKVGAIFQLFGAITGININPKIFDKGPLAAALGLIFGESAKNNILGMWGHFKKVELYNIVGASVARSLAPVIIKYSDVDLLKDISEDAYKYALLEADHRLLYNFAAYYKLPPNANNNQIVEIFEKFSIAANNLRPNWAFVNVNGVEQVDGYFITYGSFDFIRMLGVYVNKIAVSKYDDETIFNSGEDYEFVVTSDKSKQAAIALHALANSLGLSKSTTSSQIRQTLGLVLK